ncbi:carboxypeptidase [Azorhizobium oxalatiphilum]|uniref:Carboxypeptidase n=1 Tax=Azorhizobium oxalatiphilum TaxID=980631 RepID=A0A917FEP1_9HYPH|nr:M20/M25/M40 family metallo-hydrolase [Azorhizobium oxalatiphilum]GGF70637.1 carboxypeptidase [Azorhizobium oxalatiphilum]
MDLSALPFDTGSMLARLRPWVECESPTYDPAAVSKAVALAARDAAAAGGAVEHIPGPPGLGDCARIRFPHAKGDAPGILVMGHFDTVHPIGTLAKMPFRQEGDRCWGPGIMDMKGGTFTALEALIQLTRAGIETPLPVTFLFTSDEEIGTPGTRDLIETEAKKHKYVLVPEPGLADKGVTTGRYAIARYKLTAHGRPSHAGSTLKEGRSAIREMARRIPQIEDMTSDDCTFSVGVVHGGQWVNCVATTCEGEALSMAKRQVDLDSGTARILALNERREDGTGFEVTKSVVRPVWEPDAGTQALYEQAKTIAASIGLDLPHRSSPGGSDGNFTGALGIPTLDSLGPSGKDYHTLNEHIIVHTLAERGRLIAGLMAQLS